MSTARSWLSNVFSGKSHDAKSAVTDSVQPASVLQPASKILGMSDDLPKGETLYGSMELTLLREPTLSAFM